MQQSHPGQSVGLTVGMIDRDRRGRVAERIARFPVEEGEDRVFCAQRRAPRMRKAEGIRALCPWKKRGTP